MITKLRLKNFKKIESQEFEFTNFDFLVGANNSGKSTVLQALAIWQYCVEVFKTNKKSQSMQIVLSDFTALPLPEFLLLWKDKTERKSKKIDETKRKPDIILIDIEVFWKDSEAQKERSLNVKLRYQSPQSIYASPECGFEEFKELIKDKATNGFPEIVYVPPFSGLEPIEKWQDDGNVRQNIGKGQPGSVLRNLLYRAFDQNATENAAAKGKKWLVIKTKIKEWFGIDLKEPNYTKGQSTQITIQYRIGKKDYDIISAGSGFHQILTLLAFLYGYPNVTTVLFDEPDAHLHTNLQKQILSYLKTKEKIQFLIATHSDVFINGAEMGSIISMLGGTPQRIQSSTAIINAMNLIDNVTATKTKLSPYILYVEGEDDERILSAWAKNLGKSELLSKFYVHTLQGGSKEEMKKRADIHFNALKAINQEVKRIVLLDYDSDDSFHPEPNNEVITEWKRKNIDNYLLVSDAWKDAVQTELKQANLFNQQYENHYKGLIEGFFTTQNLNLPQGINWQNNDANIFQLVDGKKILFKNDNSLFNQIQKKDGLMISRQKLADHVKPEYMHQDILDFFEKLEKTMVQPTQTT